MGAGGEEGRGLLKESKKQHAVINESAAASLCHSFDIK